MTSSLDSILMSAKLLDQEGFRREFRRLSAGCSASIQKVERLQEYSEPGDPSYEALSQGKFFRAVRLVRERILAQREFYEDLAQRGITFSRIRVVEPPLTEYLRYEFMSYLASAELGERIVVVDAPMLPPVAHDLRDCVIFDDLGAVVHKYDPGTTRQVGGWLVEGEDVRVLLEAVKAARLVAIPLDEYSPDW